MGSPNQWIGGISRLGCPKLTSSFLLKTHSSSRSETSGYSVPPSITPSLPPPVLLSLSLLLSFLPCLLHSLHSQFLTSENTVNFTPKYIVDLFPFLHLSSHHPNPVTDHLLQLLGSPHPTNQALSKEWYFSLDS